MMSRLRVLVVGVSIAGPTTAYWLAKTGALVTVIERFPKLRTDGQNVDIRTSGVSVMRKMAGMEPAVQAKRAPIEGMSLMRDNGRPYGVIRASGNPDRQTILSEYEIFRGDLAQVLFDLTEENENIKYRFDEQIASISHSEGEDGPVKVEFTSGSPAAEYDLVIACDGATSRTRALGLGCGVRDHILPSRFWAVYLTIKKDLLNGSSLEQGHSAVGGRFFSILRVSSEENRIALNAIFPKNVPDATRPFREAAKQGDDALKRYIAQHFRGAGWRIDEVLEEMMDTKAFYASEVLQVRVPSLSRGRFVLVGDAGYAGGFSGTGTTLALTGAYMLAGEISKHRGDLAAGLRGYEERMRPLITEMQTVPPFVPGIMAPQTAWRIWLRNHIFALIAWTRILEYIQRFFGNAFADTKQFPLPEYEWVS